MTKYACRMNINGKTVELNDLLARQAATFLKIVKEVAPSIETLETRNSDDLDFHELSVEQIKNLLRKAHHAGMVRGMELSQG